MKTLPRTELEDSLRQALLDTGLSRTELSEKIGMTQAHLSFFLNRKRALSVRSMLRVAKALGLKIICVKDE